MNEHLVPNTSIHRVTKPSSIGAHVYLTWVSAPRPDLDYLESQSDSPRLKQRFRGGRPAGFTLIEVITTIVVLAIAATALLSVFTSTVRGSADPMIQQQAVSISEAYMEEILIKDFTVGPETTRANFDDVQDYNGLTDVGARDQSNNPITGLGAYTINVTVFADDLNGITSASGDALRIDVTVSHAATGSIVLSGYRTNY